MTTLREAATMALEALYEETAWFGPTPKGAAAITALRAALAQQQAKPQGCDHCNHPLYAATRCRVCGRVTEQAEPKGGGNLPPPLQEPAVAGSATTQQQIADTPPSDYRRGYWDGFNIGKREGRIEAEDKLAQQAEPGEPVGIDCCANCLRPKGEHQGDMCPRPHTTVWHAWDYEFAPPQRKPLTDEEIAVAANSVRWSQQYHVDFARAIERAHGITDPQVAERLACHGIPMPEDDENPSFG